MEKLFKERSKGTSVQLGASVNVMLGIKRC